MGRRPTGRRAPPSRRTPLGPLLRGARGGGPAETSSADGDRRLRGEDRVAACRPDDRTASRVSAESPARARLPVFRADVPNEWQVAGAGRSPEQSAGGLESDAKLRHPSAETFWTNVTPPRPTHPRPRARSIVGRAPSPSSGTPARRVCAQCPGRRCRWRLRCRSHAPRLPCRCRRSSASRSLRGR